MEAEEADPHALTVGTRTLTVVVVEVEEAEGAVLALVVHR